MPSPNPQQARRTWWRQFGQLYAVALLFTVLAALLAGFVPGDPGLGDYEDDPFLYPDTLAAPTPGPTAEMIAEAEGALLHNDLETAIRQADAILAVDPYAEAAMGVKANALLERYWLTSSASDLEGARALLLPMYAPGTAQGSAAKGNLALADGDTAAAVAALEQAVQLDAGNAYAQHQLGFAYAAAGYDENAVAHFTRALELAPTMAWVQNNLLASLVRLGRCDEPIGGLAPEVRFTCHNQVGIRHYEAADYGPARQAFERAVALAPDSATFHLNLAAALIGLGQYGAATTHAQDARRLGAAGHWVFQELGLP